MVSTKKNEEAVSPVIGVILMVAVTVILAAIIAAFVFGMAGNIQSSKTVGMTLTVNSSNFGIATISGGPDVATLNKVNYTVNGGTEEALFAAGETGVGKVKSIASVNGKRVILIGIFNDGTNQILVDRQF